MTANPNNSNKDGKQKIDIGKIESKNYNINKIESHNIEIKNFEYSLEFLNFIFYT